MTPRSPRKENSLIDRFGRPINGVRVSLNPSSECNYHCVFCHNEGIYEPPERLMKPDEVERIVRILNRYSVDYVKLTGGEPLLRPDIVEIISRLNRISLREISLTTNGTRLSILAESLKGAGLKRVNISLPSLKEDRYSFITGTKRLQLTLEAVHAAIRSGLTPLKVNMVILKGVNDDEIADVIGFVGRLAVGDEVILQLIELVEEGGTHPDIYDKFHIDLSSIEEMLKEKSLKEIVRKLHLRHRYLQPNGAWVEVVKPMHNSAFCMGDNRIRITYDGKFKPCLLRHDNHVDFLQAMRGGTSDEGLVSLFRKAVQLREPFFEPEITSRAP
jgi:cyclic pyranopterin phosphate synthase